MIKLTLYQIAVVRCFCEYPQKPCVLELEIILSIENDEEPQCFRFHELKTVCLHLNEAGTEKRMGDE
jgi:hypothetical protein